MNTSSHHRRRRGARRTRRNRRSAISSTRPLVAFLLIASFGILFAGCGGATENPTTEEEFSFTADDIAKIRELTQEAMEVSESDLTQTGLVLSLEGTSEEPPVLDLSLVKTYNAIRSGPSSEGDDLFRVTNEFLNVRERSNVTAPSIDRLISGDVVKVIDFVDAAWAHIELANGTKGYVAQRYISKLTSESKLTQEREKYKDSYFVDFGFLNVRKSADTTAEKIGELPGQAFVTILSQDDVWARIPFEGGEGYVAVQYLSPFSPNFLVRQEEFALPILHYRIDNEGVLFVLASHLDALKQGGLKVITLNAFRNLLLQQEERDVRLDPNQVVVAVSGIKADTFKELSDVLRLSNSKVTLFIQTNQLGLAGITEKNILTLLANGHDIQSAGHTGDDLRSLTNAQLELELAQSRRLIEQQTKKLVFAILYPVGGVNDRVAQKAQELGYLLGVGAAQERVFTRSQFLKLPSFSVTASASGDEVVGLIKGE